MAPVTAQAPREDESLQIWGIYQKIASLLGIFDKVTRIVLLYGKRSKVGELPGHLPWLVDDWGTFSQPIIARVEEELLQIVQAI